MKNFRKVLALVLVVATLFSFTAMASAKKYEDAADIDYKMAVDVLSAVGILDGYEVAKDEYEFHPDAYIEREEMAKMIAVLANAGTDVSTLYAKATPFADVPETAWSASYVAYCAKTGIIDGMTATTFAPDANVTALQTAKMLLVVLGFDGKTREYTGANWDLNVMKDAKVMGLFAGFPAGYDVNSKITRELAAQMMLNALQSYCVIGVKDGKAIKLTNALVYTKEEVAAAAGQTAGLVTISSYATLMDSIKAGKWAIYEGSVITTDALYTKLFPGLKFDTDTADCYKRATTSFEYVVKGVKKASGTYSVAGGTAFNTQVDLNTAYKAEKAAKYAIQITTNAGTPAWYWDFATGAEAVAAATGNGVDTVVTVKSFVQNPGTLSAKTVYYLDVNIVYTYVGRVENVNKYTKTFDIIFYNGETKMNAATGVAIKEDVKENDFVLFTICDKPGHLAMYGANNSATCHWTGSDVHAYEVVTGKDVTVSYSEDWTTKHPANCKFKSTEGETFYYNWNFNNAYKWLDKNELTQGQKKTVYLDKFGYIMLVTDQKAAAPAVAVFEEDTMTQVKSDEYYKGGKWNANYTNHIDAAIFSGAPVAAVELADVIAYRKVDAAAAGDNKEGTGLSGAYMAKNDLGVATLMAYTTDAYGYAIRKMDASFVDATKMAKIGPTSLNLIVADDMASTWLLSSKTSFMVRTMDAATGDYTYEEIVGVANLPYTYGVSQYSVQALDLNADNVADYVYIEAEVVANACEFIILEEVPNFKATWDGIDEINNGVYDVYRALVNGVESLVAITEPTPDNSADDLKGGVLYTSNLAYAGVALAENDNLPLYKTATPATAIEGADLALIDVVEIAEGEVRVVVKKSATDAFDQNAKWIKGIDELPVYYLVKKSTTLNGYTGVWTEYNDITKQLSCSTGAKAYMVTNASGVVTAIYVVTADWSAT